MKNISLQTKFFIFSSFVVLSVFVMVAESNTAIRRLVANSEISKTTNLLIRNHMEADMMHDAIRGDVLRAILAYRDNNLAALKEARGDVEQHGALFNEKIEANLSLALPASIRAPIVELAPRLDVYYRKARRVIETLDRPEFHQAYADFEKSFRAMAAAQAEVSDVIKEWSTQVKAEGKNFAEGALRLILIVSVLSMLLSASVPFYARSRVFKPLRRVMQDMQDLAKGNTDIDLSLAARHDEIGAIGKTLQVFKENRIERDRLEEAQKQALIDASEERKRMREKLARDFETEVQSIITSVAAAAEDLCQVMEKMQQTVGRVSQQSESVSSISQRAANNVANVSAAVEEMSASVKEIAAQALKSSGLVGETVNHAVQADKTTHMLSGAVMQISGILQLIQDIAGQINLLALNATIESARAGDAGKGFAVVASEVKNLANQTTKATEEIATQIENVQHASNEVIEVLKNIQEGIASVNQYSSGISSAVEEQSAATREISANMQHAALGVQDITGNITGINSSASEADQSAHQALGAAQSMMRQADLLKEQVARFLVEIQGQ